MDMVCILGPTATGKTRVAAGLARAAGGEVVSADSRQVYRRMDIGTGKDLEEYRSGGSTVPYHLIDIAEPGEEFSVFDFQKAFLKAYGEIRSRGRLPILCGGTGLYIDSVLRRYRLAEAPRDEALRAELEGKSREDLVARLASLRALHNTTDTDDRERLIRAIEIADHAKAADPEEDPFPPIETKVYGLALDRDTLRQKIAARLRARLAGGMIEEVKGLLEEGLSPEKLDFYGLEYRFVTRHVLGELNRNDLLQKLASAIFGFAKRQEKFFRWMERKGARIAWLNAGRPVEELVRAMVQDLKNL